MIAPGPTPAAELARAAARLARSDPVLAGLVARFGPPVLSRPAVSVTAGDHFAELVRSIVYQQLAGRAAAAIHVRMQLAAGPAVSPETILGLGQPGLRQAGLSAAKATAISGLAQAVVSGALDLQAISDLDDDQVVAQLSSLRGIGRWTAEMFCMFGLGRPDVWPATDYGVRRGYAAAWDLAEVPKPRVLAPLGERYRPWRSLVAWYCWRVAENP